MGSSRCAAKSIEVRDSSSATRKISFGTHNVWYEHPLGTWTKIGHVSKAREKLVSTGQEYLPVVVTRRGVNVLSSVTDGPTSSDGSQLVFATVGTKPSKGQQVHDVPTEAERFESALTDPQRRSVWQQVSAVLSPKRQRVAPSDSQREEWALADRSSDYEDAVKGTLSDKALMNVAKVSPRRLLSYEAELPSAAIELALTSAKSHTPDFLQRPEMPPELLHHYASRYAPAPWRVAVAARAGLTEELLQELLVAPESGVVKALVANESLKDPKYETAQRQITALVIQEAEHSPQTVANWQGLTAEQLQPLVNRPTLEPQLARHLLHKPNLTPTQRATLITKAPSQAANLPGLQAGEITALLERNDADADAALASQPNLLPDHIDVLISRSSSPVTGDHTSCTDLVGNPALDEGQILRVHEFAEKTKSYLTELCHRESLPPSIRQELLGCEVREVFALRDDLTEGEKDVLVADRAQKVGKVMARRRDLSPQQIATLASSKSSGTATAAAAEHLPLEYRTVKKIVEDSDFSATFRYLPRNMGLVKQRFENGPPRLAADIAVLPPDYLPVSVVTQDRIARELVSSPANLSSSQVLRGVEMSGTFGGTITDLVDFIKRS